MKINAAPCKACRFGFKPAKVASFRPELWMVSIVACAGILAGTRAVKADDSFVYAVQVNATVQSNPPQITLHWQPDPYTATSYTISRKTRDATSWVGGPVLAGSATSYVDSNVSIGGAYEYRIVKQGSLGYRGYGYIYAGISAPLVDSRGGLVLIVATNATGPLKAELERLQMDLAGDGWAVIRHDVSTNDSPQNVRSLLQADYYSNVGAVKAAFLFGRVPIFFSGDLNYDTHLARPMPADAYYGDMDGDWSSRPGYLPSDVELMVGRVDLAGMPGVGASSAWPNETELLRNYLNKDHLWRHNLLPVRRLALMGNRRGDEGGEATAASGYRNFDQLVGPGNTYEANIQDYAPADQRWSSMLGANSYLFAYGCGAGEQTAISFLGTHDVYAKIWSTDVVGLDAKAVFVLLFGSWFGNWESSDDIMRSFLATPSMGLAACMAGRPHWFIHHMGLGEPVGFSTRLTMNNSTLYESQTNNFARAIYISLMGDPTLRLDPVSPPANFTAIANTNAGLVSLNWSPSGDTVIGYHVYRSANPLGPYNRLTATPLPSPGFTDMSPVSGANNYMVKAIKLETRYSGSYSNASQGVFASISTSTNSQQGFTIWAERLDGAIAIKWKSQPGASYKVQSKSSVDAGIWTDLSDVLVAPDTNGYWVDWSAEITDRRLYRIVSP